MSASVRYPYPHSFITAFFRYTFVPVAVVLIFVSCGQTKSTYTFSTDTALVSSGKALFEKNCASCHHFNVNGIGPSLSGVTQKVPAEWLIGFIKNPPAFITSKDKRADSLFHQFKSIMPPFPQLQDNEMTALLAFLHTQKAMPGKQPKPRKGVLDPYPDKIKNTGLTITLVPVTQFPPTGEKGEMPATRITKLDYMPGSHTIFVNDLRGTLYKLKNQQPVAYLNMAKYFPAFMNTPGLATGFGSFAFHPSFAKNGLLYTTHTEAAGNSKADFFYNDSIAIKLQWVLTEWKIQNRNADTLTGPHRELMRIDMVSQLHGVQEICFNPVARPGDKDYGMLYIGIGDGGCVEFGHPQLSADKDKIWSSVIRINPLGNNSANGKYGIPTDNPFVKTTHSNILPEVYAAGFRNPHRITWTTSGMMLVSNIGQTNIESVNLVKPGLDFGWPVREGSFVLDPDTNLDDIFPLPANDSINNITYPIAAYDHDEGNAITGGYEYQGASIQALKGKFLFGDITSGRLFYINISDIRQGFLAPVYEWQASINGNVQTLREACGSDRVDLRFGRDAKGELYVITKADGMLYKMVSASLK
ncbi:MAG: PQQ-dependent sugar dehydrogenase [Chitinophagaceae bacterium]|nr:PQQ-dependent sugar dehydrogenase [Chitinophagaceae bacterium]